MPLYSYNANTGKVIKKLRTQNKKKLKQRLKGLQKGYAEGRLEIEDVNRSLARRKCGLGLLATRLEATTASVIALSIVVLNLKKIWHPLFGQLFLWLFSALQNPNRRNLVFVQ